MKNPTADKLVYLANGLGCSIYDVLESIGTITKSDAAKWAADFMVEDPQMIEILAIFQAVPADKREMLIETLRLMSKGSSE